MKFEYVYFREGGTGIRPGVESTPGRFHASRHVSDGIVDYEGYYELAHDQYREFLGTGQRQWNSSKPVVGMSMMTYCCNCRAVTVEHRCKGLIRLATAAESEDSYY
jgi:hypothetical protein